MWTAIERKELSCPSTTNAVGREPQGRCQPFLGVNLLSREGKSGPTLGSSFLRTYDFISKIPWPGPRIDDLAIEARPTTD